MVASVLRDAALRGALWFTEKANKVGRITTAGAITEHPIAGDMSNSSAITAGPDGALWFTENPGNTIGRITTAGSITEFPLQTVSRLFGICPGSDGNVWFTEFDGDRIGRITPAGVVTEFFIPTVDGGPYVIAKGPDGNLWFTEFKTSRIKPWPEVLRLSRSIGIPLPVGGARDRAGRRGAVVHGLARLSGGSRRRVDHDVPGSVGWAHIAAGPTATSDRGFNG